MNMTTCWNSSVNIFCAINETSVISWLINGRDVVAYHTISEKTIISDPVVQSTITIPGSDVFDGANVTCYYKNTSLKLYSSIPAFLRVQGLWTKEWPCLVLWCHHLIRSSTELDSRTNWKQTYPTFLDPIKWRTYWVISGLFSSDQGWKRNYLL